MTLPIRKMRLSGGFCVATALLGTAAAAAEAPRVAVDIAPVHALVASVMEGVAMPTLIVPAGASPHGYAMRPSEAAALSEAEIVIWIGPELMPDFGTKAAQLAPEAERVTLLEVANTVLLEYEEDDDHDHGDHAEHADEHGHEHAEKQAEAHGHDHGHDHGEEHAHGHDHGHDHGEEHAHGHGDEHAEKHGHDHGSEHAHGDDHAHGEEHAHAHGDEHAHGHGEEHADAHGHGHDHGHDHSHEGLDPHAWLSPANAAVWLDAIADVLSAADPAHAAQYAENAAAASARIAALDARLAERLAPVADLPYAVHHEAYRYFEKHYGLTSVTSIAPGDAVAPGPRSLAETQAKAEEVGILCVFAEPNMPASLVEVVAENTGARTATIDPLGGAFEPGPALYEQMLEDIATSIADCLEAAT